MLATNTTECSLTERLSKLKGYNKKSHEQFQKAQREKLREENKDVFIAGPEQKMTYQKSVNRLMPLRRIKIHRHLHAATKTQTKEQILKNCRAYAKRLNRSYDYNIRKRLLYYSFLSGKPRIAFLDVYAGEEFKRFLSKFVLTGDIDSAMENVYERNCHGACYECPFFKKKNKGMTSEITEEDDDTIRKIAESDEFYEKARAIGKAYGIFMKTDEEMEKEIKDNSYEELVPLVVAKYLQKHSTMANTIAAIFECLSKHSKYAERLSEVNIKDLDFSKITNQDLINLLDKLNSSDDDGLMDELSTLDSEVGGNDCGSSNTAENESINDHEASSMDHEDDQSKFKETKSETESIDSMEEKIETEVITNPIDLSVFDDTCDLDKLDVSFDLLN